MEPDETKGAIASHGTPTSTGAWDAGAAVKRLKPGQKAAYYREAFAWVDPEADATKKDAYKFPHHEVGADGTVGSANVAACQATIAVLNGGRGGSSIPAADRKGVWNHVARHLRDAKLEPAPLKSEDGARSEIKSLARHFELKALDEEQRTFEGILAAYSLDQGGDVIEFGAFKKTLREWNKGKGRIIQLIDSHNRGTIRAVVGKLLEAEEKKDVGLWTKWQVIDGPDGDEALRRLKGEYVDGLSIGYRAIVVRAPTEEEARTGVWRFLKEVQLKEGSLVVEPMNTEARVDLATVKAVSMTEEFRRDLLERYTAEEIEALKAEDPKFRALLETEPPDVAGAASEEDSKALAPDDPRRLAMEETMRDLTLASLGTGD